MPKGLEKTVMIKHVLRNALILVTTLVFMFIPWLISGAVVIENMFGLPGNGQSAAKFHKSTGSSHSAGCVAYCHPDRSVQSGDILMGVLDPRIRLSLCGGDK